MFTGASQFAFASVISNSGAPFAGAATAALLGVRNALYGLRLTSLLGLRGARKVGGAQLVIDESTAVANAQYDPADARLGFFVTGASVFVLWNVATLIGALGAQLFDDPRTLGLDAAVSAALLALLAPRVKSRETWTVAIGGAAVALVLVPLTPAGVPVLCAALVALVVGRRKP
jgi:predicted branched-subunit amino acid permease